MSSETILVVDDDQEIVGAIAAALEDGSMDQFVAEANELASGETYEGLLDAEGNVAE